MPFKDPAAKKAYLREYYQANKAKQIAAARAWAKAHPESVRETNRKWYVNKGKAYRAERRDELRAYQRAYSAAHVEETRDHNRRVRLQRYGLTVAEYEAMVERQGGVCAICHNPETHRSRNGEVSRLPVDHDHVIGSVRALLCHSCNTGVGSFYDDPARLRAAAEYIESFKVMESGP